MNKIDSLSKDILYITPKRKYSFFLTIFPILFFCFFSLFIKLNIFILGLILVFSIYAFYLFALNINTDYILTKDSLIKKSFNQTKEIALKNIKEIHLYTTFLSPWGILSAFNAYNGQEELLLTTNSSEKIRIPVFFKVADLKKEIELILNSSFKNISE